MFSIGILTVFINAPHPPMPYILSVIVPNVYNIKRKMMLIDADKKNYGDLNTLNNNELFKRIVYYIYRAKLVNI